MIVAEQLRALIVDDNTYARLTTAASLATLGVNHVEAAESGASAICMLRQSRFDVVFMDWYMPDISGAGVLQVVRDPRFGATADLPVIVMTAYPTRETLARARALGVTEILAKPFAATTIANVLGRVFAGGWESAGAMEDADGGRLFL